MNKRPTVLCVLDGLGLNPDPKANSVALAKKPTLDKLFATCPWTTLITHGTRVGLPEGHMGNSEVGHLNIGAGRVVEQWLYRITKELNNGFLTRSEIFNDFCSHIDPKGAVHLIGLFSYGGVHSDARHLMKIIDELASRKTARIVLHLILDGRDTSPTVGKEDLWHLISYIAKYPACVIGTISGRFFAMDRDKRWQRTEQAWRVIAAGEGTRQAAPVKYLEDSYAKGITDEFIEPVTVNPTPIDPSDSVFFFNFRADRMRQIVTAIRDPSFTQFDRSGRIHAKAKILCMTEYDATFGIPYLFDSIPIKNHLGEVIASAGLSQLRAAETEKYPHVTYFFNGLQETPLPREERKLIPSPREIKTYDLKPEMSAAGVRDVVLEAIASAKFDFILVNFANCDMVGHTGVLSAAVRAVETVDGCLGNILSELDKAGGQALIIADHGNAEQMIDYETGAPHTAHTTFPVPAILYGHGNDLKLRSGGALCDVAPTILKMIGLQKPVEMSGQALY